MHTRPPPAPANLRTVAMSTPRQVKAVVTAAMTVDMTRVGNAPG